MSGDVVPDGVAEKWRGLILDADGRRPPPVTARTPVRPMAGISDAVAIDCDDGRRYVVKGQQVRRALVADQIVGRLGLLIEAPVPEVGLVTIPSELIVEGSYVAHFEAGLGHGSIFIPNCVDSRDATHDYGPENDARFARLAVLYGWTHAGDRQFLYRKTRPRLVYSVDHGYFFPDGPNWTAATLEADQSALHDTWIAAQAGCSRSALRDAIERLQSATDDRIAEIVAIPPISWGITMNDRIALANYFARRRDQILSTLDRD